MCWEVRKRSMVEPGHKIYMQYVNYFLSRLIFIEIKLEPPPAVFLDAPHWLYEVIFKLRSRINRQHNLVHAVAPSVMHFLTCTPATRHMRFTDTKHFQASHTFFASPTCLSMSAWLAKLHQKKKSQLTGYRFRYFHISRPVWPCRVCNINIVNNGRQSRIDSLQVPWHANCQASAWVKSIPMNRVTDWRILHI